MNAAGRKQKIYRQIFNPLDEMTNDQVYSRFRFDKHGVRFLSQLLQTDLQAATFKSRAIPVEIQVCVALRYLSSNDFQIGVADDFNVSQTEVSLIVTKFLDEIIHFC
ncbi:MAG: hypothetical protein AAGK05_17445 [Pseudomonadota bacterium]